MNGMGPFELDVSVPELSSKLYHSNNPCWALTVTKALPSVVLRRLRDNAVAISTHRGGAVPLLNVSKQILQTVKRIISTNICNYESNMYLVGESFPLSSYPSSCFQRLCWWEWTVDQRQWWQWTKKGHSTHSLGFECCGVCFKWSSKPLYRYFSYPCHSLEIPDGTLQIVKKLIVLTETLAFSRTGEALQFAQTVHLHVADFGLPVSTWRGVRIISWLPYLRRPPFWKPSDAWPITKAIWHFKKSWGAKSKRQDDAPLCAGKLSIRMKSYP